MRFKRLAASIVLLVSVVFALAQEDQAGGIGVSESGSYGPHLVTDTGQSLYIYLEDEQGSSASACIDSCTRNWPAFQVEADVSTKGDVDQALLGSLTREDGSAQVTFNGWPLYTYARDTEAGHTKGAGLGGVFYLVSSDGEPLTRELAEESVEVEDEVMSNLVQAGAEEYARNCAVCHGAEGQGQVGPGLAGNSVTADASSLIRQILLGSPAHGMPPFAHLDNDQIASISTFVRNSWSNDFGAVLPEHVEPIR